MKAIALKESLQLEEMELPIPTAKEGEVLVKIKAIGLNPVDYKFVGGLIPIEFPTILGHDYSGEVVESSNSFNKGDRVYGYLPGPHTQSSGALAEYITLPKAYINHIPKQLSFEKACAYPLAGMTALECFNKGFKHKNDNVFIAGITGGVGLLLAQMLHHAGVNIYCTVRNEKQQQEICDMFKIPVDQCCILDDQQDLFAQVTNYFEPSRFNSCFDLIGGDFKLLCLKLTAFRGDMITIVEEPNFNNAIFDIRESLAFQRSLSFHFIFLSAEAYFGNVDDTTAYQNDLISISKYIDQNVLSYPVIKSMGTLNVKDVTNALNALKDRTIKANKLVITIQ